MIGLRPLMLADQFVRGDVNSDGRVNLLDVLVGLHFLFRDGPEPCRDALDVDDNGSLGLVDVFALLDYLSREGPPPPTPFPTSGEDPSADGLDCARHG